MPSRAVLVAFVMAILTVAGCGDEGGIGKPLHPVKGTVTRGGQPVANITVVFNGSDGYGPRGTTNAEGVYELNTGGEPGAPAGEYTVTFIGGDVPEQLRRTNTSTIKKTVQEGPNTIDPIELPAR
jgi:hypothetical protein